jgi:hypothetical protein
MEKNSTMLKKKSLIKRKINKEEPSKAGNLSPKESCFSNFTTSSSGLAPGENRRFICPLLTF